jgi:hypothetical protein
MTLKLLIFLIVMLALICVFLARGGPPPLPGQGVTTSIRMSSQPLIGAPTYVDKIYNCRVRFRVWTEANGQYFEHAIATNLIGGPLTTRWSIPSKQ